jgi:hypothetical protein
LTVANGNAALVDPGCADAMSVSRSLARRRSAVDRARLARTRVAM